jgi:hypothetical protein
VTPAPDGRGDGGDPGDPGGPGEPARHPARTPGGHAARRRDAALAGYLRFAATVLVVGAAAAAIGCLPTLRLGGAAAIPALLAGSAVAVIASAIGGAPIAWSEWRGRGPQQRSQAILMATGLRLLTAVALGLAALASGRFAARPLAAWIAIGYLAQLAVDSRYAVRVAGRGADTGSE